MKLTKNKLTPTKGTHLKQVDSGLIFEGSIYLGCNDSKDNYVEVSEEEYLDYINGGYLNELRHD